VASRQGGVQRAALLMSGATWRQTSQFLQQHAGCGDGCATARASMRRPIIATVAPPTHSQLHAHAYSVPVMSYLAAALPARAMPSVWCSRFHTRLPCSPAPRSSLCVCRTAV
jgi:hypothetical protein